MQLVIYFGENYKNTVIFKYYIFYFKKLIKIYIFYFVNNYTLSFYYSVN